MSNNSDQSDNIVCFICEKDCESDNPKTVNVTRGIETLKRVSLERNDERHKVLIDKNTIKVHVKCREKYALKKNGKFIYSYSPFNFNAWKFSPAKKKLRRFSNNFCDLKKKCFICDCGEYNRQGSAGLFHIVKKPSFQEKFQRALESNYDEISKKVMSRISCIDLIAEEARYHLPCYLKIMNKYLGINSEEGNVGRPKIDLSHSMEIIYKYIEDAEEKVFTLQELMELIGK